MPVLDASYFAAQAVHYNSSLPAMAGQSTKIFQAKGLFGA
jgi:hypothetical protein